MFLVLHGLQSKPKVTACEKSQRWQSGLLLLADASAQLGHAQIDLVIYNAAISACEKAGEWQQAIQVLAKLHQEQVQSSTVTCSSTSGATDGYRMVNDRFTGT